MEVEVDDVDESILSSAAVDEKRNPSPNIQNFAKTFREFDLKTKESGEHAPACRDKVLALREELQRIADSTKNTDPACHICVFGLMGHGKSRLLNLILTALPTDESNDEFSDAMLRFVQDGREKQASTIPTPVRKSPTETCPEVERGGPTREKGLTSERRRHS